MELSVLDRSRVRAGRSHAEALRDTVAFAREVEELGYRRFWVAEHHAVPGVAGSAPTVLAAAVAAATSRIRVGTGGVMLPNHRPLVVAEQFGVLESLFPGRIDMGLGRSVGFTGAIRRALGHDREDAEEFGPRLAELLAYFRGDGPVRAYPAHGLRVSPFVLATGAGALTAAAHGVPLVIGAFRGEDAMLEAVGAYRARFTPSPWAAEPYVVVSTTVAVADTAEEAWRLLLPEAWAMARSRTRGDFPPLVAPDDVLAATMTARERAYFEQALRGHVHGTPTGVAEDLTALVERTGADEVLVTTSTHDREALLTSYRLLATLIESPTPGLRESNAQVP
ncbi:MsnO8 family LLM class oxidoreductase [Saccharothrix longispora]|uniref:MsnO8 family LLM class oxidoreductase n=1 Tax=Saccharothrix longispora TaxID=33920 RepID=UPI0028FD1CC4|nr:MsnO8 family LLM class oxidoreductase [Saccharothrix longispora]MBY8849851.1 MsnO8 family LLM class oxidoreductase [Saccharothrix sp. MB29]MDU0291913.1 MsnO8 family LLM class oxidoreductase [Saccharothrix longispora]